MQKDMEDERPQSKPRVALRRATRLQSCAGQGNALLWPRIRAGHDVPR